MTAEWQACSYAPGVLSIDRPANRFVIGLLLLLGSPLTLYLERAQAIAVVAAIIALSSVPLLASLLTVPPSAAALFPLYYLVNAAVAALFFEHRWVEVLNELAPVLECWACFLIARQANLAAGSLERIFRWSMAMVGLRAGFQALLLFSGNSSLFEFPTHRGSESLPVFVAGSVVFERTIDPMSAVFMVPCLLVALTSTGRQKKVALFALLTTGLVSAASLLRAAWIASAVAAVVGLVLVRIPRKALLKFALGGVLAVFLGAWIMSFAGFDVLLLLLDRTFYTEEQMFSPASSLQQLRFLEYGTAWNAFSPSPVFGSGVGSTLGTWVSDSQGDKNWILIHNYWLNLGTETGIVGVILLFLAARSAASFVRRRRQSSPSFIFAVTMSSWYICFLFFHPIYSAYHIPAFIGVCFGLLAAMERPPLEAATPLLQECQAG